MQTTWKLVDKVLQKAVVPIPVIRSPNDILVKTRYIALNPIDWRIRDGYGAGIPMLNPTIGHEFVGDFVRGPAELLKRTVSCFMEPYAKRGGALAEYVLVRRSNAVSVPDEVTRAAACVPYSAAVVWRPVMDSAHGTLVVIGAAGGQGHIAIQLARFNQKISRIIAVCRPNHVEFMKQYQDVEVMDSLDIEAEHLFVLDLVGLSDVLSNVRAKSITYCTTVHPTINAFDQYGFILGGPACVARYICEKRALSAKFPRNSLQWIFARSCPGGMSAMISKLASKKLAIFIDKEFCFDEVEKGLEYLKNRKSGRGKVVIRV